MTIEQLYTSLIENNGFTVSGTLEPYNGVGYAVSVPDKETVIEVKNLDLFTFQSIINDYVTYELGHNQKLGAWVNGDKVYFDVSEVIPELDQAIKLGVERNQLAIFDFNKFESIPIN